MTSALQPINVLVGCELSGVVREAFRALGANAYSCDLQPARDSQQHHMQMDARAAIRAGVPYTGARWDLLIAHPPCTYLCNSGVGRLIHTPPNPSPGTLYGPARWQAMRDAAQLFADLWHADVPHVALENPIMHGHAAREMRTVAKYAQTIQPYQFGDDASKRTALWLRGLPKLEPLADLAHWARPRRVTDAHGIIRNRWSNQTDSGQNKLTPSADRAELRSDTYPGIARAMAAQWIAHIRAVRG